MSLEMAHKVILPPKKNYIPQFLKQRDINSYYDRQESLALYVNHSIPSAYLQPLAVASIHISRSSDSVFCNSFISCTFVAKLHLHFGIQEWHPSSPPFCSSPISQNSAKIFAR
jgi:hypothetical protein